MGPLAGITVIEIVGLGPAPFGAMLLADMGATVIRLERPGGGTFGAVNPRLDVLNRGKRCLCINLKQPEGVATALRLVERADVLLEGFRPGVMEKLGLGPEACLARNPRLVYGRMTGWGQEGPLAQAAGHDLNYIALTGALHAMGRAGEKPAIPLNLVGDFGGGGLMLAFGVVCALLEARQSGRGQVVDAAMVDGASTLMASTYAALQAGFHSDRRGTNLLDSGAHFYEVYETADGKYVSLAPIEPQFYAALLEKLGDDAARFREQFDAGNWPRMKDDLAAIIRTRTRDEWDDMFAGVDACYAPVLSMGEVKDHPHHRARGTYLEVDGVWQPAPAPRFSRTAPAAPATAAVLGQHSREVLGEFGFSATEIGTLLEQGVIVQAEPATEPRA